jgi:hypothetical protein
MGSSAFQSPAVFGTLGALARKIQEMAPVVNFLSIKAKLKSLKLKNKTVQNLSLDLTITLSNKVKALEGQKQGGVPPLPLPVVPPVSHAPAPSAPAMAGGVGSNLALEAQLNGIQHLEIHRLVAAGDNTAVKFAGLGLKSLEETKA